MDDNSYPQANAGANELTSAPSARQPQFQSTASKRARSRGTGKGTSTRSRASPRSSPYEPHSTQAVAGRDGPVSLTPAGESSVDLPQDGLGRLDVTMVDARGNHLRFPYHTRYPPVRIVESGTEGGSVRDRAVESGTEGGSVRDRAVAPRPASREIGEGGDGDPRAGTTQPLFLAASQGFADRALKGSIVDVGQRGSSRPAQAQDVTSLTSLDPDMRRLLEDITSTGPYYLPSLMDPVVAAESAYVSPYPPLPRTHAPGISAQAVPSHQRGMASVPDHLSHQNRPLADAETSPYAALPNFRQAAPPPSLTDPRAVPGAESEDSSSDTTLRAARADLDGLGIAQLEHLDFPSLDTFMGGYQPATGAADSALDDDGNAWANFFANDDMYVPMDEGFDFSFLDGP